MSPTRRPPGQTAAVLRALAARAADWRYGYDLSRETGLAAGSLYPILMRLSGRGQLEAQWEPSEHRGRPARHMYRLTAPGLALAATAGPAASRSATLVKLQPRPQAGGV
jgi:PadR family transcriptional regulator, regulatory protein PadR